MSVALIFAISSGIIIVAAFLTKHYFLVGLGVMWAVLSINSAIYTLHNDKSD